MKSGARAGGSGNVKFGEVVCELLKEKSSRSRVDRKQSRLSAAAD